MKKFLSLVLAMIMTMSLVTISAGATEYKDLTDKDEIQYEEAVAVLNRIGVITGYDDGSFRPETELTRGAAAKIIVSLLIGPEAANNLPNTYAPYPDVPANHTFAGVISYCKTAGIISGYGDGTFKPANSLTGYAFAKMLLGAIGYDSAIQGYVDTGWTMNVARDGNAAGLFNRIEFDGAAAVNREQACQLALNTLKATMVEYTGGLNVTAGNATVTAAPTLTYKISNQSYATNISNRKASNVGNANVNNHYTVEFGEEHFKDLRLNDEHGTQYSTDKDGKRTLNIARDDFGRPSNKWSYKKVTIGTFPIEPDFVYTERVIHRWDEKVTDAAKVRALELSGYNLKMDDTKENEPVDTTLWMNGVEDAAILDKVADIANYTDNGTQVEVYISEDDSDFIQDVVVVKTQLMEIKNIKSEAVALKVYDDGSDNTSGEGVDNTKGVIGFNSRPLDKKVNDVEVNDECYKTLSGMKVGDIVAVIPVAPEHENEEKFDVSRVYVPETVSGELTWVDTYGTEKSDATGIAVTVGGTDYDVALWNKDLTDIDGTSIRVTRKDVTLYLDEFGNALLAKNVGSTSDFMVIGGYHSGLVDGKVVTYADGWDIKGNEISLNIGNARYDNIGGDGKTRAAFPIGSLVHYSSSTNSKYAEWKLDDQGVFDVASKRTGETTEYTVKASNSRLVLNDYKDGTAYNNDAYPYYSKENDQDAGYVDAKNDNVYVDDNGVKVIYLTMGDDGEVDSVEVKSGMQNISNAEILGEKSGFADEVKRAQACVSLKTDNDVVNADSLVKAIVVKLESGNADLKDLIYVSRYLGSAGKAPGSDNTQRPVYGYEVHFVGSDDWDDEVTIYSYQDLDKGDFARARKPASFPEGVKNVTEDNFYTLTRYSKTQKALSTMEEGEIVFGDKVGFNIKGNKTLIELANYIPSDTNFSKAWPKDSKQDELDLGDDEIINILSLRGAKIIDLTKHEVQTTSEMVDELKELNKTANGELTFTVSALYNDDKDSDGFRDVHVLVITGTDTAPKHVDKDMFSVTVTADEAQVDVTGAPAADVKKGTAVTLTITKKDGFKIDEVTVDGTPVVLDAEGKITITVNDDVKVVVKSSVDTPDEPAVDVALEELGAAKDDATAGAVKASSKSGKLTVTGLPAGGAYKVVVVADGKKVSETTEDAAIDFPAGAKAYIQKAVTTLKPSDEFLGGWDMVTEFNPEDLKGIVTEIVEQSLQNAGEELVIVSSTFQVIKIGDESFTVNMIAWTKGASKGTTIITKVVTDSARFKAAADKSIADTGTISLNGNPEPAQTGFVNVKDANGKQADVEVPVKDGVPQVEIKNDYQGNVEITKKEGVTEEYKVGDQIVTDTPIEVTPDTVVEVVKPDDPIVTGLPFKITVSTKSPTYNSKTKKPSELWNSLNVDVDADTKTINVSGELLYTEDWNGAFGSTNPTYFADLTVEQTNTELVKIGYKSLVNSGDYRVVTSKNDDVYTDGTGVDGTKTLSNNITIAIKDEDDLAKKAYLKTYDAALREEVYTIDLSGLKLATPELLKVTEVKKESDKVCNNSKKISDIQTGVTVETVKGADGNYTVKLAGHLIPVVQPWTDFASTPAMQTGYMVAVDLDGSAVAGTKFVRVNTTGKPENNGTEVTLSEKTTAVIRVAGLDGEKGKLTITAMKGSSVVTYTFDYSGLTLDPLPGLKVGAVKSTDLGSSFGNQKTTSFQKDVTADFIDGEVVLEGTLNAYKWSGSGWGDVEANMSGYYVAFHVDASGIEGAKKFSVSGPKGLVGPSTTAEDDVVLHIADLKGEEPNADGENTPWTVTVMKEDNSVIKTFPINHEGLDLQPAEIIKEVTRATNTALLSNDFKADNGKGYLVSDLQSGVTFDVDNEKKTITASGTLYHVEGWAKWNESVPAEQSGWYIVFTVTPGVATDTAKSAVKMILTDGREKTDTNAEFCALAKDDTTGEVHNGMKIKVGDEEFALILSELDFSETVAEATGTIS